MTCLGYALLHPGQLDAALTTHDWKLAGDDAVDVVMSAIGLGDVGVAASAWLAELDTQVEQVGAQFEALGAPGGPFGFLSGLGDLQDVDMVAVVERAADFLCDLQPGLVHGLLTGMVNQLGAGLPVLDPAELGTRLRTLLLAGLATFEGPLLRGRDDMQAHRGYRAAVAIRVRLDPLLDRLEDAIAAVAPLNAARSLLDELPTLDEAVVAQAREVGCFVRDRVLPLVRCMEAIRGTFTVSVEAGGAQGMPDPPAPAGGGEQEAPEREPPPFDDTKPAPFEFNDWLHWMDVGANASGFAGVVFDIFRTRNPASKRVAHLIFTDVLRPAWILLRGTMRATRAESVMECSGFTRFLFSDLGDFAMVFLLEFLGSIDDMCIGYSNWVSSMGLRIVKYYTYVTLPRTIYLSLRSWRYVCRWSSVEPAKRAPTVPMARFGWLLFGPTAGIATLVASIVSWTRAGWERFSIEDVGFMLGMVCIGALSFLLSLFLVAPWARADGYRCGVLAQAEIEQAPWAGFGGWLAALAVIIIGTLTFHEADPGGLTIALAIVLPLLALGLGIWTATGARGAHGAHTALMYVLGLMMSGVLTAIVWWWVWCEGKDRDDVFDGLEPGSSPYLLPYPAGETWLCGQDTHGFFSHYMYESGGDEHSTDHYAYDLNEGHASTVLASRAGIVTDVRDGIPDGDRATHNFITVQHLDWAAGHDPGWDLERAFTYSDYLHLARRGVFAHLGQFVPRGLHVAASDDTGRSAMHHLHWEASTDRNDGDIVNMPSLFREGKPKSLAFITSQNSQVATAEVAPFEFEIPLQPAGTPAHDHDLRFRLTDLSPDGTVPASVTLLTDTGTAAGATPALRHVHRLDITGDQIRAHLHNEDHAGALSLAAADGHTHAVLPRPRQPATSGDPAPTAADPDALDENDVTLSGAIPALVDPPPGLLLARRPAGFGTSYNLLGHQMLVRINDRATRWYSFGAHRAKLAGAVTLDRGPAAGSDIRIVRDGTDRTHSVTANLMARAAAADLSNNAVTVRTVPVLVVETRRRGTAASLAVPSLPGGMAVRGPAATAGTGRVGDLGAVGRGELRDLIEAAFDAQSPPTVTTTRSGTQLDVEVGGNPVDDYAGSTPRLADVLGRAAPAGTVTDLDPLPLGSGMLRLGAAGTSFDVPIVGAPSRAVVDDLAAARLEGPNRTAESLVVQVGDDAQAVRLISNDAGAERIARRIMTQAEGVRAWADAGRLVVETVALGTAASLSLSKGTAPATAYPVTAGEAPALGGGAAIGDSTALFLAELERLIDDAHTEAGRPAAPAAVSVSGDTLKIEADDDTAEVRVEGPALLMGALGVGPSLAGTGSVEIAGLPASIDLEVPGWLDVSIGTSSWRVHVAAEPARLELDVTGLPADGDAMQVDVDGAAVPIDFAATDVTSLAAVAARIGEELGDRATLRVAYRYSIENARYGQGDIEVEVNSAQLGAAMAGFFATSTDVSRATGLEDASAVTWQGGQSPLVASATIDGPLTRAFGATGGPFALAAADGGPLQVDAVDVHPRSGPVDPLGLLAGPVATPVGLGRESVGYVVTAGGTSTVVELNAAPAHLHTVDALEPGRFAGATPVPLTITATAPDQTVATGTVDLAGVTTVAEAAARIQREAPFVVSAAEGSRLNVDSPGGGSGWRLAMSGEPALLGLGFRNVDAAGTVEAAGAGNVADGAAVTEEELVDVFDTIGGLATVQVPVGYAVEVVSGDAVVSSDGRTVAIRSEPPELAAALTITPDPAGPVAIGGGARLDSGWLIVEVDGAVAGVCPVWGRRARIVSHDPLPADLTAAGGTDFDVTVDGTSHQHTLPAGGFASADELVSHLNLALGPLDRVSYGLETIAGADHLRIESRARGSDSDLILDLSAPATLGFTQSQTRAADPDQIAGAGNVDDLASVSAGELRDALEDGLGFAEGPQTEVTVTEVASTLRLAATGGRAVTLDANPHPEGLAAPLPAADRPRPDVMEYPYATPLDTGPHLTELDVRRPITPGRDRDVRALLHAAPARLGPMRLPANRSDLDGLRLSLAVGPTDVDVVFDAVTGDDEVIDQVERAGSGLLRARVVVTGLDADLHVETAQEGSGATIAAEVASNVFPTLGLPSPDQATGTGNVGDARAVTLPEYVALLAAGSAGPRADRDDADVTSIAGRTHARLSSEILGCSSAVVLLPTDPGGSPFAAQLSAGPAPLDFEHSAARGPAVRAAVTLPAFVDTNGDPAERTLDGVLSIRVDDNGPSTDLSPPRDVQVTFAGDYSAAAAAAEIDAALAAANAGSAAAYPDQVVVIETLTAGLAGSVTVPSPDQPSDQDVLDALGLAAAVTQRGWPGAGIEGRLVGFRGLAGQAAAAATWRFQIERGGAMVQAPQVAVAAGDDAADIANRLDAALRDPAGDGSSSSRIGVARLGNDGALLVELYWASRSAPPLAPLPPAPPPPAPPIPPPQALDIRDEDGAFGPPPPDPPPEVEIWLGGEPGVEPAMLLRRTDLVRTFRVVRFDDRAAPELFVDPAVFDPDPAPAPGSLDQRVFDIGWMRPPTNPAGAIRAVPRWADGRWLLSARVEGARTDAVAGGIAIPGYGDAAEMILSAGSADNGGEPMHFAHRVQYWMELRTSAATTTRYGDPLRLVRRGDDYLVDYVVP